MRIVVFQPNFNQKTISLFGRNSVVHVMRHMSAFLIKESVLCSKESQIPLKNA